MGFPDLAYPDPIARARIREFTTPLRITRDFAARSAAPGNDLKAI